MTNRSKMWLKPTDQMDLWLETQGYYRKHTARDGTCLFRAVAEQLGLTQHYHLELRRQCVDYVLLFDDLFKDKLTCTLKEYEDRMRISTEWGGEFELDVISRIYKCDFLLFQEVGKPAESITNRGYEEKIMLCVSQEKHYDSVYTKQHISNTAYCQSLVYEQLYKRAFGLMEVDFAVKKMLHDKAPRYQRDPCMSINGMALRLEMRDTCLNVKELLLMGVTPFPYKVAKSLDPEIYRNVEYDTWNDYRKGLRYGSRFWTSNELCVGVKCLVKLENDKNYHGFIQEMEPDKGPVLVFIEELGEKMSVLYDCLELLPQPQAQPNMPVQTGKQLRQLQAVKLALHAQPDSTLQILKKNNQKNGNRQKCKEMHETENKRKNANSCDSTNDQQSLQSSNYLASASSECYEHELDYQQEMHESYQHVYPTQSCEITSSSIIPPEGDEGINMTSCPPVSPYAASAHPNNLYQIPPTHNPPYCAVNLVPTRSIHPDGSDLPMADLPTLRYYYNIGLDYMRMNYVVQPPTRSTATHCYPMIQSPTQYIPETVPVSYVSYEQPQPVPAVFPDPVPVTLVRPPLPVSAGLSTANEPDSTSSISPSRNQPVAPRFKNKRKNEHQTAPCASPPQMGNNNQQPATNNNNDSRHRNHNVAQQQPLTAAAAASSSSVPTSPAPSQLHANVMPTHYMSVQPSYSPTAAAAMVPPPIYYHPVECDRSYCTSGGYYDYTLYDMPTSTMYPTTIYSPQTTVPQTSYVTTDGIYYQSYVQPATIEY